MSLAGGVQLDFNAQANVANGVSEFRVLGIETSATVDVEDPFGFVSLLSFVNDGPHVNTQTGIPEYIYVSDDGRLREDVDVKGTLGVLETGDLSTYLPGTPFEETDLTFGFTLFDSMDGAQSHVADNDYGDLPLILTPDTLQVDLRIVVDPTTTDPQGQSETLPQNVEYLDEWEEFQIEIWGSTPADTTTFLSVFNLDLQFDGIGFEATGIEFGPAFTSNQSGVMDNASGQVIGLSAATTAQDIGIDDFVLLARVQMKYSGPNLANNLVGSYILPDDVRDFASGSVTVSPSGRSAVNIDTTGPLSFDVWPVMFNLDDSGEVGFGDVAFFANIFGDNVTAEDAAFRGDFDRSGQVGFGDVVLFAQNFGRSKSTLGRQSYASNFPSLWEPAALLAGSDTAQPVPAADVSQAPLTQTIVRDLLNAAVDQFDGSGLSSTQRDTLRSVDVRVQDLPDGYLGLATEDAIIIDADASGAGWFIDASPYDDLEFEMRNQMGLATAAASRNRFDLLTVIVHELGHIAGLDHSDQGWMSERLNPGERRLPEPGEIDDWFARFSGSEW